MKITDKWDDFNSMGQRERERERMKGDFMPTNHKPIKGQTIFSEPF